MDITTIAVIAAILLLLGSSGLVKQHSAADRNSKHNHKDDAAQTHNEDHREASHV